MGDGSGLGRTDSRGRLVFLVAIVVLVAASLIARLGWWQVVQRDQLVAQANAQLAMKQTEPAKRGTIYDRTGKVVLATTVERDRLIASTQEIGDAQRAKNAETIISILGLTGADADEIRTKLAETKTYIQLARNLTTEQSAAIRQAVSDGKIRSVSLQPEQIRVYPQAGGGRGTSLAAQLLGFVNGDGEGQYGIEQQYQSILAGTPRVILAERDIANRPIADSVQVIDPGVDGTDIRLTIDAGIQLALEQEVFAAWVADQAKTVSAVVMDPKTGEVLAEASYPSYDANTYKVTASTAPGNFVDPVISDVYEPGSVFKFLTASAVIEKGVVAPSTVFNDPGTLALDGGKTRIYDSDKKSRGLLAFQDGIALSRNVVAAQAALKLGSTTKAAASSLYATWTKYGFGAKTGIDLAGEVAGIMRDPNVQTWRQIDLANGSFGQGVAVTPIQLVTAYSAMVNGGTLVTPHVADYIGSDQVVCQDRGRIISSGLSSTLTGMLSHVLTSVSYYASRTLVPGYVVGGKTGTAQIWDPTLNGGKGDWKENLFNYSFVGYIGHESPELVVAIQLNEATPTRIAQGKLDLPVQSYELFRRIATNAISRFDSAPVNASATPAATNP